MTIQRQARQAVLDALLSGTALPGGVQPLLFPDSPHLVDSATVVLIDAGDPVLDTPARVQILPRDGLVAALREHGSPPVLEFLEPEHFPGMVGARLRVSRLDDQARLLPLGEVIATFTPTDTGELVVGEPTHTLAF